MKVRSVMRWLRYHWYDWSLLLAIVLVVALWALKPSGMALVLWLSLGSLFLHQVEEWRWPGYFSWDAQCESLR